MQMDGIVSRMANNRLMSAIINDSIENIDSHLDTNNGDLLSCFQRIFSSFLTMQAIRIEEIIDIMR